MIQGRKKHFKYYWTTHQDSNFNELQKVEGSIYISVNGLILGIVKDRNNLYPKDHVICGMQVGSHVALLDVRSFDFLNPVELLFDMPSDFGESIANTSSIAYMKMPMTPSKVIIEDFQEGDLNKEEILSRCQAWMKASSPKSIFYLRKFIRIFSECLETCSKVEEELSDVFFQGYLDRIRILKSEEDIINNIFPFPIDISIEERIKKIGELF